MTVDDVGIEYMGLEGIVFNVSAADEAPAVVDAGDLDKENEAVRKGSSSQFFPPFPKTA